MSALRAWFWRLGGLFGKERRDQELADEIESHVRMQVADNIRAGMSPEEARRQALLKLGGVEQTKEQFRDRRGVPWLESLLQDLRFGLRMLRKSPGFTIVAVLTLALGIGANTAIFSVVNKVLLQPLGFPHADRVVMLERSYPEGAFEQVSIPKFVVWRDQGQAFQAVGAFNFGGPDVNLTGGDHPDEVTGIRASAGYFDVFEVPFVLGRAFNADEDRPGAAHVVVISSGLWRSRYGGDPEILGKTIAIGGDPYEVIGVVSSNFIPDPLVEVWMPLQADPNSTDEANYLFLAARLRDGVTLDQARAVMKLAAEEFRKKYPLWMFPGESATAETMRHTEVAGVRPALLILLGAVGFVLLLACANMANLLLARATIRKREIAVRSALGAKRGRVVRQLLTESLMLSLVGGVIGLFLGFIGIRLLLTLYPVGTLPGSSSYIPFIGEHGSAISIDWRVVTFAAGVSILTGILFGLFPAVTASRSHLNLALKESSGRWGTNFRQGKARSALVVSELALAVILLAGAALLIRTLAAMRAVDLGFDPHSVITMQMSLTGARFEKTASIAETVRQAEHVVGAIPGVVATSLTCCVPVGKGPDLPFTIGGRAPANGGYDGDADWRFISPYFFSVFRIPLLQGRTFTDSDDSSSTLVAVINESMAKQFWPNHDVIGAHITIGHGLGPEFEEPPREIVGVVSDVRDPSVDRDGITRPLIYVPVAQLTDALTQLDNRLFSITWAVRTNVPPFSLSNEIQERLRAASGGLPVAKILSMDELVSGSTAWNAFNAVLFTAFGSVALFLAAIGIYGLMAYSVEQRRQEIGIRVALGAQAKDIRNIVLKEGAALALAGILLGVSAALALTRLMRSLLFGVKPWDLAAYAAVVILLGSVALLAAWIPARRAMRVDPMVALRHE